MSLRDVVFGSGSVLILLDAVIGGFDLLLSISDLLLPLVTVIYGTLAPEIWFLDFDVWPYIVVFVAALYVINLSQKIHKRVKNHDNST